jgi:hypothetical protein
MDPCVVEERFRLKNGFEEVKGCFLFLYEMQVCTGQDESKLDENG